MNTVEFLTRSGQIHRLRADRCDMISSARARQRPQNTVMVRTENRTRRKGFFDTVHGQIATVHRPPSTVFPPSTMGGVELKLLYIRTVIALKFISATSHQARCCKKPGGAQCHPLQEGKSRRLQELASRSF